MEGAHIKRKLRIGNGESGTSSLFLILVYITSVSKVQIGNKEPVLDSFFSLCWGLCLFRGLSISSACKACNDAKQLALFACR